MFTHLFFWAFFAVVLLVYTFVYKGNRLRTTYLLLVSLFFYFKTSGVFLLLLLLTICSDYYWGNKLHKSKNSAQRKAFVSISVLLNLFVLAYFKYAYFFTSSYNQVFSTSVPFVNHFAQFSNSFFGTNFNVGKLLVPVGVSFFTFQSLSYTIDIYRGKTTPVRNVLDYGFFVSFFPHLVAGPIVKARDFTSQMYQPYALTKMEFGMAVFWIMNGYCKKIVADYLAVNFVDRVFDNPNFYSGLETLIGIFMYSLQIYMDFSGYTDMAIGLALVLGFRLMPNFNSPYKASSPSEFWKRWHMSLSSWLQEYLYFPLGGNRKGTLGSYLALMVIFCFLILLSGKTWLLWMALALFGVGAAAALISPVIQQAINTNINLMVTMLLGGLWHGSSALFIIWGGLNGLGLIAHKLWQKVSPFKNNTNLVTNAFLVLFTLTFISFTRIFFRSDSMHTVSLIFDRLQNHFGADLFLKILKAYRPVLALMLLGYLIHWIPENYKEHYRRWFAGRSYTEMALICLLLVFAMYQLISGDMQPFIYFQF